MSLLGLGDGGCDGRRFRAGEALPLARVQQGQPGPQQRRTLLPRHKRTQLHGPALLVDRWCVLISRVVAQVRFNKDGRFLVSTGGMDTATIVWRHLF